MDCTYCGRETGDHYSTCAECELAADRHEAKAPEREQRARERLDSEGYYDDPIAWAANKWLTRRGV